MRKATPIDLGQEDNDFSRWQFTFTQDYQLIKQGQNELTAKISCFVPNNPNPQSEWHTVNVTGVVGSQPTLDTTTHQTEEESADDPSATKKSLILTV